MNYPSIWKFELQPEMTGAFTLMLPDASRILSLQVQRGIPCIWVLVKDTQGPTHPRHFEVYPTGGPIPMNRVEDGIYIGTFQIFDGNLVGHLFDVTRVKKEGI